MIFTVEATRPGTHDNDVGPSLDGFVHDRHARRPCLQHFGADFDITLTGELLGLCQHHLAVLYRFRQFRIQRQRLGYFDHMNDFNPGALFIAPIAHGRHQRKS